MSESLSEWLSSGPRIKTTHWNCLPIELMPKIKELIEIKGMKVTATIGKKKYDVEFERPVWVRQWDGSYQLVKE